MTCLQLHVVVQLFLWRHHLCEVRRPPEIDYPSHDEILYYRDNEEVHINCTIRDDTEGMYNEFKWTQHGAVIPGDRNVFVDTDTGVLNIRSFSQSLEATYRCIVSRTFGMGTPSHSVVSTVSPAIYMRRCWIQPFGFPGIITLHPIHLSFFSINCGDHQISTGPITYRWFHVGTNTSADDGQRIYVNLVGTLFFNEIRAEDRGKYLICSISADLRGVEYIEWGIIFWLNFYDSSYPIFRTPAHRYASSLVVATRQSDATLECVFSNYAAKYPYKKYVYWYLPSGKLILDNAKYRLQYVGRRLTIRNVTEDDEVYYTCKVHDYSGSLSAQVLLNVTSEPVFTHGPPASRTVIQGADAEFNCEAVSVSGEESPDPVVWYINAARMGSTYNRANFQLSQNDTVLTVKNAQKAADIMCVQCEVSNNVGTAFANACLNILLPMIIVTKPPAFQMVVHGDVVNLTVRAQADPAVKLQYRWECGYVGFDLNTTPPYVISNPKSMDVYINTSLLPEDMWEDISGHYNIVIYYEYETTAVGTDVLFNPPSNTTRTTKANEGTTSSSHQATLPHDGLAPNKSGKDSEHAAPFNPSTMVFAVVPLFLLVLLVLVATMCALKQMDTTDEGTTSGSHQATLPQDDLAPNKSGNASEQAAPFNPSTMIIAVAPLFILVLLVLVATMCTIKQMNTTGQAHKRSVTPNR